jgi:hypothetical protein
MSFAVNEETVPAHSLARRTRLDPAQVHASDSELAEYVHQGAGMIVGQKRDH